MENTFDIIVIGGGPAGMIAAGRAAQLGKSVLLLEKNSFVGKKLLITGGGRCNITNANLDLNKAYKDDGKYLFSSFSQFGVEETLNFFRDRGLDSKIEQFGRVFPITERSQSVLDLLVDYMEEFGVKVMCNVEVKGVVRNPDLFQITLHNGETYTSTSCIIATGGKSHPETGSTGSGFQWAQTLGHKVIENDFALVPIATKESWVKNVSGLSLQDIKITVLCDGKKVFTHVGKVLFTHVGLSGPTVLNMSKRIGDLLSTGEITMNLDLFPTTDHGALKKILDETLLKINNKMIKNSLGEIVPASLAPVLIELAQLNPDTYNHSLSKDGRKTLVDLMKSLPLTVSHLLGSDKAIVSSGGVSLEEINFKTMESKIVPGLYLVGDMLNIDRPSGGFSLQICWTTGYVAGQSA